MIIITIIAGARPNFVKVAPIIHEINKQEKDIISYRLVHTGQHYDDKMSHSFFNDLNIPKPDINLNSGGGTHAEQTAKIMIEFEKYLIKNPTDLVLVVGDVNSTLACSIVAKKLKTRVAHVEAGIRSNDMEMPDEINRLVTDSITDLFFTTTRNAGSNLIKSGIKEEKIYFVGNVMIDTLLTNLERLKKPELFDTHNLSIAKYFVLTLHRPKNVDTKQKFIELLNEINRNARNLPVIFPLHPRNRDFLNQSNLKLDNIIFVSPLGYLEFNYLVKNSLAVITDSGGITEETTVLGIPCYTLRENTERPETCSVGTNHLIGTNPRNIKPALDHLFSGNNINGQIPELWDGQTAKRIVNILRTL